MKEMLKVIRIPEALEYHLKAKDIEDDLAAILKVDDNKVRLVTKPGRAEQFKLILTDWIKTCLMDPGTVNHDYKMLLASVEVIDGKNRCVILELFPLSNEHESSHWLFAVVQKQIMQLS